MTEPNPTPHRTKDARGEQRYVLVVDDVPIQRELLSLVLRNAGFEVGTAANGVEALERVRERRPSVILVDVQMPVMNGIEFARELRLRKVAVPLVVMSASGPQAQWDEIDAAAYTSKDIDQEWLVATVRELAAGIEED